MPVLRVELSAGVVVEASVTNAMVPRIKNATALPDIPLATWDKMPKETRKRMIADYDWFSNYLTEEKINDKKYATRTMVGRTLGFMNGNR